MAPLPEKTCRKCGHVGQPEEFFEPESRSLCRTCRNAAKAEQRARARLRPRVKPDPFKTCSGCAQELPSEEFAPRADKPDGLESRCVNCVNRVRRAYWERTRERRNDYQRDQKYGLAPGQYEQMLVEQGGVCAICATPPPENRALAVDHDHSCCSGRKACGQCVRGLLCSNCNNGLGHFQDDTDLIATAIGYLETSGGGRG